MKKLAMFLGLAVAITCGQAQADLVITGVYDGSLPGGNPKAIILTATCDVADLSTWGVGSANNGGGSDGEEVTFSGSIAAGEQIVVTTADNTEFFTDWFEGLQVVTSGAANINGDDAIELFNNGSVTDVFGDINVDGNGEPWEYLDSYAIRTDNTVDGAFVLDRYSFGGANALDGFNEQQNKDVFINTFGFTPSVVPEPGSFLVLTVLGLAATRRRR